jgi:hypothetical protein
MVAESHIGVIVACVNQQLKLLGGHINVKRVRPYQRVRPSITGLRL